MRILVATYIYAPDTGASASMFAELCKNLVKRGNEVLVITTVPHFPSGIVNPDFRGKFFQESIECNVRIIRINIPSLNRQSLFNRLIQFAVFQIGSSLACLREQFEVAIISNPALNKGLAFFAVQALRNKPSIYFVADVYPDVGAQTNVFNNPITIGVVRGLEKYCLQNADIVWILSKSFYPRMKELGVSPERIIEHPVWVDTKFQKPGLKVNEFSLEYSLEKKFVILYAGNMGLSQGLENVLHAAEDLKEYRDIEFVFIGDGTSRDELQARSEQMKLENVKFMPFQPWERVPEVIATADVCVVSLKSGIGLQSLPSKTFTYLASGRPVLAIVDEDSALWSLIEESDSGICVPYGKPSLISSAILKLYHNAEMRGSMGENARALAEKRHSVEIAAERVEDMAAKAIKLHTGS